MTLTARTSRPLVTALIPTRNRAHCLPRALDSVHAQRGRGEDFDLDIVVVDDGSTDATAEVVRRYPHARYLRLPEWRGVSAAVNEGLRTSRGRYVALLDDDDEWLPHKLEVQVPVLERHPEVGVVYGQSLVRRDGVERVYPRAAGAPSGWVFVAMLERNFCGHHASCLIRREAFEAAGDFDESLDSYEDYDVSLRLAFHVRFLFVPGVVDVYNQSRHGLWLSRAASGAAGPDAARVIEKALALLPDSHEYTPLKRRARAGASLSAARAMLGTASRPGDLAGAWRRALVALRMSPAETPASIHRRIVDHLAAAYRLRGELARVVFSLVLGQRA